LIKVVCIGVITIDTIALVEKYPTSDERVLAERIVRSLGGPAAVAAVALARLKIPSALIGTVGNDADGKLALSILKDEGVDISGISITEQFTSGSVITVSKSEKTRAIATRQPINQEAPNASAHQLIKSAEWIHVDQVGVKKLDSLGIKRGLGPKISFDAGYGVKDFDVNKVDLFAPNDRQMAERHPNLTTAEATQKDAEEAKNLVVTTMGSKGSVGYSETAGIVSANSINGEILSTLGAGDVFHGALLAQLITGFDLQSALTRANAVAGLSCRGLDGISAIPNNKELDEYLKVEKK